MNYESGPIYNANKIAIFDNDFLHNRDPCNSVSNAGWKEEENETSDGS